MRLRYQMIDQKMFNFPLRSLLRGLEIENSTPEFLAVTEENSMAANSETLHTEVIAKRTVNFSENNLNDK